MTRVLSASLLAILASTTFTASAQDVKRSIMQVTDSVYRFNNNFHSSMVVVTDEGIVVGDPINADAAAWLEVEIEKRWGKPITYAIFSHSHADHASGGQVWEDTAQIVAHENFAAHIDAGRVDTARPDITFADSHVIEHGGKTFEMTYLGAGGHGDDMIATVVRPDNVGFIVDVVSPGRLPWRTIPAASIEGYIGQIRVVESLDFEILLPGHAKTGTRADATASREYVEALRDRVQARLDAGDDREEIIASVTMDEYKDWLGYEQLRPLNVEGMIAHLTK